MPAFVFSLQKVLDYRRLEEGWAKDAFRAAQDARFEGEAAVERIRDRRKACVARPDPTLAERLDLEAYHAALDREETAARERLTTLEGKEAEAREAWRDRRVSAEALAKLREAALDEWKAEEARREQADLDEWAVLRR